MKTIRRAVLCLLLLTAAAAVLYTQSRTPNKDPLRLADETARTAWLTMRGWQVGEPEISETQIPVSWQTVPGQSWLRLQAAQGLHPEDYAGCAATRVRYPVTNGGSEYMYAELLLCGDILVGAQVYDASTQLMQSVI